MIPTDETNLIGSSGVLVTEDTAYVAPSLKTDGSLIGDIYVKTGTGDTDDNYTAWATYTDGLTLDWVAGAKIDDYVYKLTGVEVDIDLSA